MMEEKKAKKNTAAVIAVALIIAVVIIAGIWLFLWAYGPKHALDKYFDRIQSGEDLVLEEIYEEFILEDYEDYYQEIEEEWREAEEFEYNIIEDEAWRQEISVSQDEEGDEIEEVTKFKPYYQWLASNYRAWVRIKTEDGTETYVLEFKRKSDDEWSVLGNITKPWLMYDIWYEDEYEDYMSFDEEGWDEDILEIDMGEATDTVEATDDVMTDGEEEEEEVAGEETTEE